MKCEGITHAGKPCGNSAKRGEVLCASHLKLVGRKGLLTEDTQHKVTAALRSGNFIEPACLFAGIGVTTYYSWRERGEADEEAGITTAYSEFREATTRAIAEGEMVATAKLAENVRNGDQRAIEFYLERRHADRWARRERVDLKHSGSVAQTLPPEVPDTPEHLTEVGSILAQIGVTGL